MYLSIFQNHTKAIGKNKTYALISITHTLALALLNILFLVYGQMGVRGYLLANVLATFLVVLIYAFVCEIFTLKKRAVFNVSLLKQMLKYSMPLMVDGTLWWIIQSSNKLFVEFFLDAEVLGFYTVAIKIPALMYVIVTIFSQAWGISTVKETENSNDSKFYSNVFKIYTFLTFFVCIMLVSIIKPFMSIYVNPNYFLAWQYTPLLLIGNAFLAVSDFFGAFYNALKMPIKNMIVSAVAAFVSVLISVSTIHYIGLWGAALSTLLAYFIIMWIRLVDIKKYIEVKINWATFIINQIILITHAGLISLGYNILLVSVISIVCFILINFKLLTSTLSKLRGHKAS
jgi:O-antigen/teichoic acid export membrane protein